MSTLNEKITNVADGVRTLSATTSGLTLDQMASNVEAANSEITNQSELISQIMTALEGKAAGGGGASVETCTVTITSTSNNLTNLDVGFCVCYNDGVYSPFDMTNLTLPLTIENVVCNSLLIFFNTIVEIPACRITGGGEAILTLSWLGMWACMTPDTANAHMTISIYDDD